MSADRLRFVAAICLIVTSLGFIYWVACARYMPLILATGSWAVFDQATGSVYAPAVGKVIRWGEEKAN